MIRGNILVVDDERSQREILQAILREEGYEVAAASGGTEALRRAEEAAFDLVLTDLKMPEMDGLGLLTRLQAAHPALRVIIMTAHGTIDSAVEAMRRGAFHYLTKPLERDALVLLVERAFEQIRLIRENLLLQEELQERFRIENLVGRHKSMQEVFRMIRMTAPTASTVLIRGESGTGKELVARAIHYNSPRKDTPFRAINCAAIPETLLESELFGYEKGAFTGATTRGIGLFEAAHGGTLFLDEIGDMALPLQAKILRVLQEMEIRRIGGKEDIPVDVRILAASNKNLEEEMRQGRFRKDLYYRLNVISFSLPPLRERATDIPDLSAHFVEKHAQAAGKPPKSISPDALRVLMAYSWPGNVRQLQSVLERAFLLSEGPQIDLKDLPAEVVAKPERFDFEIPDEGFSYEAFEREVILKAMRKADWVIVRAAKLLGMSYKTLCYRLEKFQIARPGASPNGEAASSNEELR